MGKILISIVISIVIGFALFLAPFKMSRLIIGIILITIIYCSLKPFKFWQKSMIFLLGGYIILNRGFAYIGVLTPVMPLFIGEIAILLSLITMQHRETFRSFLKAPGIKWLILWGVLAILGMIINLSKYGIYAFRDASLVYYAIFIYFGYAFFMEKPTEKFYRVMGLIFIFTTIYAFSLPWRDYIVEVSPRMISGVNLFGHYVINTVHLAGGALFFMLVAKHYLSWPKWSFNVFAILSLLPLLLRQVRASYVGIAAVLVIFVSLGQFRLTRKIIGIFLLIAALICILPLVGIKIQGRRGIISAGYIGKEIKSILGVEKKEYLASGLEGTRADRLKWWSNALQEISKTPQTLLLGKGFGMSLIDFEHSGWLALRSPHNSYVTIIVRMGILGFILWSLFHVLFVKQIIKSIFWFAQKNDFQKRDILVWLLGYYVMFMTDALFGVNFESPFGAAPLYFFMGMASFLSNTTNLSKRQDFVQK